MGRERLNLRMEPQTFTRRPQKLPAPYGRRQTCQPRPIATGVSAAGRARTRGVGAAQSRREGPCSPPPVGPPGLATEQLRSAPQSA